MLSSSIRTLNTLKNKNKNSTTDTLRDRDHSLLRRTMSMKRHQIKKTSVLTMLINNISLCPNVTLHIYLSCCFIFYFLLGFDYFCSGYFIQLRAELPHRFCDSVFLWHAIIRSIWTLSVTKYERPIKLYLLISWQYFACHESITNRGSALQGEGKGVPWRELKTVLESREELDEYKDFLKASTSDNLIR